MKKSVSVLLILSMIFMFCSCGLSNGADGTTAPDSVFEATEADGYIPGDGTFNETEPEGSYLPGNGSSSGEAGGVTVKSTTKPSSGGNSATTRNSGTNSNSNQDETTTQSAAEIRESDNSKLIILSYNVAGPWGTFNNNTHYTTRSVLFAQQIRDIYPDSFGTQEMNSYWSGIVTMSMSSYAYYAVKRGGDVGDIKAETNAIFYLKNKYNLIANGTFWLTNTPDLQSKYDGAACNRICSWVILENKNTGYKYIHMNTHLDSDSADARLFGAQLIMSKLSAIKDAYGNLPTVLTGDFNCTIGSEPYNAVLNGGLSDSRTLTSSTSYETTYNNWDINTSGSEPIDHIFVSASDFSVTSFGLLEKSRNGNMVSDHYGIKVEMNIK